MNNKRFLIITGFITLAVLSRILPHPYNFTPVGAIALFGAAYFHDKKWAVLIPLIAMWAGDLVLNNFIHSSYFEGFILFDPYMIWIYGSLILVALTGISFLKRVTVPRILGSAVAASVIFFIVTNFGVWIGSAMYPLTAEGLIACYTAAIPFFHYTLAGDIIYCAALFGAFEYVSYRAPFIIRAEV